MPPSLPGKTGSSIDALLGDLSSDMEKMGVRTSAKGQCASCGKCIVGKDCLSPFSDGCFYEIDSRPLCPLHYHARKGLLCGGCRAPISGRCVSAMGKRFHPEHFVCAFCLKQLNQGVFKEQNEKPYCTGCHEKLFV
ncbi:PAXI protein, partial [Polyodon spathula]|nr:PAXI protein [Polyodon spathula]